MITYIIAIALQIQPTIQAHHTRQQAAVSRVWTCGRVEPSLVGGSFRRCEYSSRNP